MRIARQANHPDAVLARLPGDRIPAFLHFVLQELDAESGSEFRRRHRYSTSQPLAPRCCRLIRTCSALRTMSFDLRPCNVDDKTDAAAVVFELWIVQDLVLAGDRLTYVYNYLPLGNACSPLSRGCGTTLLRFCKNKSSAKIKVLYIRTSNAVSSLASKDIALFYKNESGNVKSLLRRHSLREFFARRRRAPYFAVGRQSGRATA